MSDTERRTLATTFEARAKGENTYVIEGYAYTFGSRSENLGGFHESIRAGAGKDRLGVDDIRALYNHDENLILARNVSGTLRLSEDSTGLAYELDVDMRQSYAQDLVIAMERGDVTQSSFAFRVGDDSWTEDEDGMPLRTINTFSRLFDVSPVTYPAYVSTSSQVSKRCLDMARSLSEPAIYVPSEYVGHDNTQIELAWRLG